MKNLILLIVVLFTVLAAHAQVSIDLADSAYVHKEYATALDIYTKLLNKNAKLADKAEIKFRIAESYRYTNKGDEAINWYEQAQSAGYNNPIYLYHEGNILMKQGKYAEAQKKLNEFLARQPNDKDATRLLNNCNFALQGSNDISLYTFRNEASLNTAYSEFCPVTVKDKLVFTSSRVEDKDATVYSYDGQGFSDIYQSVYNKDNKAWNKAEKLAALNTPFNDGPFTYCDKTKTAYFNRCNGNKVEVTGKGKKTKAEKEAEALGYCKLMECTFNESTGTWGEPRAVSLAFTPKSDLEHPAISPDGNSLYFASKMEGGQGGSDIWVMTKSGNQWSAPQNLGNTVNTEFDEMFPAVFRDSILYFSSEGNVGYGGLDLFYTVYTNGAWSKPVNLKAPFNSAGDDFTITYTADKSSGYFTSNRTGGNGADDIYNFFLTPVILTVKGRVTDVETGAPIAGATVILTTTNGTDTAYTNANGDYMFSLDKDRDYKLNVYNTGYFGDSKKLSTQGEQFSKEFSKANGNNYDFSIKKIPKAEIKIDNIYYDYDSYNLREESKPSLDVLVKLLEDTPDAIVQINSHTDERGKFDYNMKLSENRAKSVVEYLIQKGISPTRLSSKGFSSSQPVVKNAKTEEDHQKNRRTTFQVLNAD